MPPIHSLFAAATLILACASQTSAQGPVFASRSELVVLSATAVDKKGRPVTDLKQQELRILEEGRPQPIVNFAEGRDVPARILLLVDASGSMDNRLKISSARMAVIQVLYALAPEDQVALAGFDNEYWGVVGWTTDKKKIESGFDSLKAFGSTALHDALDHSARDLAAHGEGRRAIVVITDGQDTASKATPDSVIARSRALDVPIYSLSVVSPLDDPESNRYVGRERVSASDAGNALLQRYADLSGGAAFVVSDFAGLKKAAELVATEIKHQYRLAYEPPDGPASFRQVQVKSTRKGIQIRTRSGYVPAS
ncbi:MAG: VWA domain-containing protein [Vicinamibacteria bacterium]